MSSEKPNPAGQPNYYPPELSPEEVERRIEIIGKMKYRQIMPTTVPSHKLFEIIHEEDGFEDWRATVEILSLADRSISRQHPNPEEFEYRLLEAITLSLYDSPQRNEVIKMLDEACSYSWLEGLTNLDEEQQEVTIDQLCESIKAKSEEVVIDDLIERTAIFLDFMYGVHDNNDIVASLIVGAGQAEDTEHIEVLVQKAHERSNSRITISELHEFVEMIPLIIQTL